MLERRTDTMRTSAGASPRRRASAPMLLAVWLSALALPPGPAIAADPTPAQKEAELKRVRSRIDRIQKEVNADIQKRDRLGAELKDAEQSVQSGRRRLEAAA